MLIFAWLIPLTRACTMEWHGGVDVGPHNHMYDTAKSLDMDVYAYPKEGKANDKKLMMLMHGGGFAAGTKDDVALIASMFARYGIVVADIKYELLMHAATSAARYGYGIPIHAVLGDLVTAYEALGGTIGGTNMAQAYGFNHDDPVIAGCSAGAVTALWAGYNDDATTMALFPSVILSVSGQLSGRYACGDSAAGTGCSQLRGKWGHPGDHTDRIGSSPLRMTPLIAVSGTIDETFANFDSHAMVNRAHAQGMSATMIDIVNKGHVPLIDLVVGPEGRKILFLRHHSEGAHYIGETNHGTYWNTLMTALVDYGCGQAGGDAHRKTEDVFV